MKMWVYKIIALDFHGQKMSSNFPFHASLCIGSKTGDRDRGHDAILGLNFQKWSTTHEKREYEPLTKMTNSTQGFT